jgi:SNF2 family DNA or RNA helicase
MSSAHYTLLDRAPSFFTVAESSDSSDYIGTPFKALAKSDGKNGSYNELPPELNLALEKMLHTLELPRQCQTNTAKDNKGNHYDSSSFAAPFSLHYLFTPSLTHTVALRLLKQNFKEGKLEEKFVPLPTVLKREPSYFKPEDSTIVQLWWAALCLESNQQDNTAFNLNACLPQGNLLEQLIPLIVNTKRSHWQSVLAPPLTLGPCLPARIQWQELESEVWAPVLRPESEPEVSQLLSWRSPPTLYYHEKANELGFLVPPSGINKELLRLLSTLPSCSTEHIPLVTSLLNNRQKQIFLLPYQQEKSRVKEIMPLVSIKAQPQKPPTKKLSQSPPNTVGLLLYLEVAMSLPSSFSSFNQVKSYLDEKSGERIIEIVSSSWQSKVKELLEEMGFIAGELCKSPDHSNSLKQAAQCFHPSNSSVWAHFLASNRYHLEAHGYQIQIAKELDAEILDGALAQTQWSLEILEHPEEYHWCNLEVTLKIEEEVFAIIPLLKEEMTHIPANLSPEKKKAYLNHESFTYIYLKDKRILRLPFEKIESILDTLMETWTFQKHLTLFSGRTKFPITSIQQLFQGFNLAWNNPGPLKDLVESLEQVKSLPPREPAEGFCGTLRPYQAQGLAWLQFIARYNLSGILADDMGLGKTIQILAHIWTDNQERSSAEELFQQTREATVLDVTIIEEEGRSINTLDTSCEAQARAEIFPETKTEDTDIANSENVTKDKEDGKGSIMEVAPTSLHKPYLVVSPLSVMHNWQNETRHFTPELKFLVFHGNKRDQHFANLLNQDIVFTTYGTLVREIDRLKSIHWRGIILDESQCIKNARTINKATVNKLKADHKVCLTGTPLENNLRELWSQFDFLIPGLLGKYRHFCKHFSGPIENFRNTDKTELLHQKIAPFLLRRTKESVAPELPAKIIIHQEVDMTPKQSEFYNKVAEEVWKAFYGALARHSIHIPYTRFLLIRALLRLRQICCHPKLVPDGDAFNESAKFEALFELLPTLLAEGRKILLFSQFTKMLDLIKERLQEEEIDFVELRGSTKDRQKPLREFKEGKCSLFRISLRAGGTGLNITTADTIIHYDPWFNPAVEDQATDRAHRIGQTKTVFVYRLITRNSVEEKMLVIQNRKRLLYQDILNNGNLTSPSFTEEDLNFLFQPPEEER